jgi:hypothetical protein
MWRSDTAKYYLRIDYLGILKGGRRTGEEKPENRGDVTTITLSGSLLDLQYRIENSGE